MHTELGTGLVSTAPLIWNAISKIFPVGIVRNLGVIKKIKVDESSREKNSKLLVQITFLRKMLNPKNKQAHAIINQV